MFNIFLIVVCIHQLSAIRVTNYSLDRLKGEGSFQEKRAAFIISIEVRSDFRFPERARCNHHHDNNSQVITTRTTTIPRRVELSFSKFLFQISFDHLWSLLIPSMVPCGQWQTFAPHSLSVERSGVTSRDSRPSELENSMSTARRRPMDDHYRLFGNKFQMGSGHLFSHSFTTLIALSRKCRHDWEVCLSIYLSIYLSTWIVIEEFLRLFLMVSCAAGGV